MIELNFRADYKKVPPSKVAEDFLNQMGFDVTKKRKGKADIIIGSKNFTEQYILAHIFEQLIESYSNLNVELKTGLAGTKICFDALINNEIDLYPEYTGTGLHVILKSNKEILNKILRDDKKVQIVSNLVNVVGIDGMVGGQFVDLHFSHDSMESSTLEYIHIHKTAALFVAAGSTAACIGNATVEEMKAIEDYARNLGFAFQIFDDILDSIGKIKEVGKSLRDDRGNFVKLYGVEKSKKLAQEYTNKAFEAIKVFNGRNAKLLTLGQMLLNRKS